MPKGRSRKRKEKGHQSQPADTGSLDDDSESVCSSLDGSVMSEDGVGVGGVEEETEEDAEFQLAEHIDRLGEKSSRTRLEALTQVNKILRGKLVAHCLTGCRETLLDIITRGLKRVSGQERLDLLELSMLLTVQFGVDQPALAAALRPLVTQLAQDPTISAPERSECLKVLGVVVFIQVSDLLEVASVMRVLEEVLRKCRLDQVVASAVRSWTLLLSIAPDHSVPALFNCLLPALNSLLDKTSHLGVRVAVGQAVALLFELVREVDESLLDTRDSDRAYELIQSLATESDRHTARKERNHQRSTFKDILNTLEGGVGPERTVRSGVESVSLNCWARHVQYDTFRDLLGPAMNTHLAGNDLLREVFQMGPPPLLRVESKAHKLDRKYYNAVMAKQRTQSRGKLRDKRTVT
ncbi:interferon-related developmental regulator 2-like [Halichondria panicea]|uniref:interferon-related developmental regulator 2-like n=1 Tax=Halichondria panicea TaxID=6063 RepID=UPI00312B4C4F